MFFIACIFLKYAEVFKMSRKSRIKFFRLPAETTRKEHIFFFRHFYIPEKRVY